MAVTLVLVACGGSSSKQIKIIQASGGLCALQNQDVACLDQIAKFTEVDIQARTSYDGTQVVINCMNIDGALTLTENGPLQDTAGDFFIKRGFSISEMGQSVNCPCYVNVVGTAQ